MMKLISRTNYYYYLIDKLQIFVKPFTDKSSTDIKLSKTQISKMVHLGVFLGRLCGPLLKTRLPLMKNLIKSLAKSVLISLGLTAAAAADAGIHKKILGSGHNHPSSATLVISNNEMEDIIKIVKSLENSGLLLKELLKQFKMKLKNKKEDFLV